MIGYGGLNYENSKNSILPPQNLFYMYDVLTVYVKT